MAIPDPIRIIEALEQRWVTPWGLILGSLLILVVEIPLFKDTGLKFHTGVLIVSLVLLVFIWHHTRSAPKTKRGKVGFAISLECESAEQRRKVRADFVRTLHKLIKGGETGTSFQIIEVPDHIAVRIKDTEDAIDLRRRLKAHFLLHGRVRTREIDGKTHHFINMEGVGSHKPIRQETSAAFSREITGIFPSSVQMASENDILSFDFLSRWTECVAKYIVGIAAALSGDLDYAEKLYCDALRDASSTGVELPALERIKSRVPVRLAELYEARALRAHHAWRRTLDPGDIAAIGVAVEAIDQKQFPKRAALLRAVWMFLDGRRVDEAIGVLKRAKLHESPASFLSLALLYAYKGDLVKAIRCYRKIAELPPLEFDTINQTEEFLCWLIVEEPGRVQLRYLLGFFEWKIKGDSLSGSKDFRAFLDSSKGTGFKKERELAEQWIAEIAADSAAA